MIRETRSASPGAQRGNRLQYDPGRDIAILTPLAYGFSQYGAIVLLVMECRPMAMSMSLTIRRKIAAMQQCCGHFWCGIMVSEKK